MNDEPLNNEMKELRDAYGKLPADEPGELTDARIRAEARRAVQKHGMRPATWIPIVSIAAAMGFAVILVPNLLLESPHRDMSPATVTLAPPADPAADSVARKRAQEEAAELDRVEVTGARMADMQAERSAPSPAARARQESVASAEAMLALPEQRAVLLAEAVHDASVSAEELRAELDTAPEQQWRVALVTLRDNQRRELAERLMPDYRRKFDFDESLTLDMLVAEVSQ
jgi:hypothetical protein